MPVNDIEEALKTTYLDHRLTRGERKGLKRIIDDIGGDERDLALARNFAFQLARDQIGGPDAEAAITWLEDVMKVGIRADFLNQRTVAAAPV